MVVVELKRDDTPRRVIAQILEYAAWVVKLVAEDLEECLRRFEGDASLNLAERHAKHFGLGDSHVVEFNKGHRLVIVGQGVTDRIRYAAAYLNERGIRLACREFTLFQSDDGVRLLHLETVVPEGKARNRPRHQERAETLKAYGKRGDSTPRNRPRARARTEAQQLIWRFWAGTLEAAEAKTRLHTNRNPSYESFLGASAGTRIEDTSLTFYYWVRAHDADVMLYIEGTQRERVFKALAQHKEEIEKKFGSELHWDSKKGKKHCRIQKTYPGGYRDEASWEPVFDVLTSAMASLESALRPHLQGLVGQPRRR